MSERWLLRGAVLAALLLALWIGWQPVRPPERVGDVPYVPTRPQVVDRMLELAGVGADDLVFDLGSGDGRIVIRAAQAHGARGRGFELDPLLVAESRRAAVAAGVADRVEFIEGDLFDAELEEATAVTLYLLPTVNLSLRASLFARLAPGTPVVSQTFDMAEWRPDEYDVVTLEPPAHVYLWIIPAGAGGVWNLQWKGEGVRSGDRAVLRLLQRFQELEGEIRLGAESLPVWGQVRGSSVVVETTRDHPQLGGLRLVGEISGDRLHGEDFQALRRPADVAGVWDVESVDDPYEAPWSLRLARSAGGWTATRRGPDTASIERPMGDLYVLGSSVSFVVGGDDGSARRVVYHGLVEGDRIDGMIHDRGALIPWTAIRRGATADRPVRCP